MAKRQRLHSGPDPVIDAEAGITAAVEAAPESQEEAVEAAMPRRSQHTARSQEREAEHAPAHGEKRRTRRRKLSDTGHENIFYIPVEEIPEGLSYEFKRWSVKGQEDPFYIASMREQGWEPVDPKRHPTWVPPGYNQPYIIKGDQILMERPMELTEEARAEQRQLAKRQVREAEQRLGLTPRDTATRDHAQVRPQVVKEIGRMVAIEE